MKHNDSQWTEWAAAAQKGDSRAYTRLLTAITPYIRASLSGALSRPEVAEDVTQEILLSVHKALNTYAPDRPFKPWLSAIINFRKADYFRQYYNKKRDMTATIEDNPEYEAETVARPDHAGEYKDIEAALDSLSPVQKRIFKMIKIQGYTAKEVANEMNMKESAVKVSAHRSTKKLQAILNE